MSIYEKFRNWLHKYGKHYWDIKLADIKCGSKRTCKICGKTQQLTAFTTIDEGILFWMNI